MLFNTLSISFLLKPTIGLLFIRTTGTDICPVLLMTSCAAFSSFDISTSRNLNPFSFRYLFTLPHQGQLGDVKTTIFGVLTAVLIFLTVYKNLRIYINKIKFKSKLKNCLRLKVLSMDIGLLKKNNIFISFKKTIILQRLKKILKEETLR